MSYELPENSALEKLRDYTTSTYARLRAYGGLEDAAERWDVLDRAVRQALGERDSDRRDVLLASALVQARDARWDQALLNLSGAALMASGRRADQPPYDRLFGEVRASDATDFGPVKATAIGDKLILKLRQLGDERLAGPQAAFEAVNAGLVEAVAERSAARRKVTVHEVKRLEVLDGIERQIVETEIEIRTRFPDQRGLVRVLLAPERAEPRDDAPAPAEGPSAEPKG